MDTVFTIATTFFILANPIGNSPAILALIKDFPLKKQRIIVLREGALALILALLFQYFGEGILGTLMLKDYSIAFCGGILLFLVALSLIFPQPTVADKPKKTQEPFLVPIATPLLAGPGLLTVVMLYSREADSFTVSLALVTSWVFVWIILLITPYLQKLLGNRGIKALEQLMGMVLSMIAMSMIVKGAHLFVSQLK